MPFSGLRGFRFPLPIAKVAENRISRDEYLERELASEIRHEQGAGNVHAMSGGTSNHQ
jgi:hypothetical protein